MKIYVIQNSDGKFLRAKGYGGHGQSWVSDLEKAKLYTNLSTVKSQCTYWYGAYPQFGCPSVLEFSLDPSYAETISMTDHVSKSIEKKKKKEAKREALDNFRYSLEKEETIKNLIGTLTVEQKKKLGINA